MTTLNIDVDMLTPLAVTDYDDCGIGLFFLGLSELGEDARTQSAEEELVSNYLIGVSKNDLGEIHLRLKYRGMSEIEYADITNLDGYFGPFHNSKEDLRIDPAMKVMGAVGCPLTGYSLLDNAVKITVDFTSYSVGTYSAFFTATLSDGSKISVPNPGLMTVQVN